MNPNLQIDRESVSAFCRERGVRKLALFGSVLREDFGRESDVDVLVEFEPETAVGFFEIYDMEHELSPFFGGRRVEIHTPKSLSKYFREEVLKDAEALYVAA